MVNKYFNNMLVQTSKVLGFEVGVVESNGMLASSGKAEGVLENLTKIIDACLESKKRIACLGGYTFLTVVTRGKPDYVIFIKNESKEAEKYVEMLSASVGSMRIMHSDKYDKANFIKNILTDSILPGEIFLKSKEMRLSYDSDRVVFAIQYDEKRGIDVYDIVNGIFPDSSKDFVIDLDNSTIGVVKELKAGINTAGIENIARQITDTVVSEAMVNLRIGIGTVASNIRDIAKSYKEARIALEVGKVFDGEKNIINYDNLGIARIIYQLPTTLCELFLSEVFKKESIDTLDQETLYTIQKFFENNLNVSETSRQLYVHRNTLVYRLDKVRKITGLDLRVFDDAIVFKIALMVKKYLVSKPMSI